MTHSLEGPSHMPWVKLDDHFDEHPKIARLDDHALALFVCGLAYCNRNLTDGFIPSQVGLGQLRFCDGNTTPAIRQLETVGMWEKKDGGWQVHDFPEYQPSREAVLKERATDAGRKAESRRTKRRTPGDVRNDVREMSGPDKHRTPAGTEAGHVPIGVSASEDVRPGQTPDNGRSPGCPVPGPLTNVVNPAGMAIPAAWLPGRAPAREGTDPQLLRDHLELIARDRASRQASQPISNSSDDDDGNHVERG